MVSCAHAETAPSAPITTRRGTVGSASVPSICGPATTYTATGACAATMATTSETTAFHHVARTPPITECRGSGSGATCSAAVSDSDMRPG